LKHSSVESLSRISTLYSIMRVFTTFFTFLFALLFTSQVLAGPALEVSIPDNADTIPDINISNQARQNSTSATTTTSSSSSTSSYNAATDTQSGVPAGVGTGSSGSGEGSSGQNSNTSTSGGVVRYGEFDVMVILDSADCDSCFWKCVGCYGIRCSAACDVV
jgi:hypothetical protein